MCAVGYDGDGIKVCKMKPGWETVLKDNTLSATGAAGAAAAAAGSSGISMQIGPDGQPVLVDNQAQKDLRAKLEEERIKANFALRERDRTRRIQELQARILEYQELRRHRAIAEDNAVVRNLEQRVDTVARTSAEIAQQKEAQMKLLFELRQMEQSQESVLKEVVQEKTDLILEKSKEEARRLAALARKSPQLPNLQPRDLLMQPSQKQNYADLSKIPGDLPPPAAVAAAESTMEPPVLAPAKDMPGAGAGHVSSMEAAVMGTVGATFE